MQLILYFNTNFVTKTKKYAMEDVQLTLVFVVAQKRKRNGASTVRIIIIGGTLLHN